MSISFKPVTGMLISAVLICLLPLYSFAATDNYYTLAEVSHIWDGTGANRLQSSFSAYGDESAVTFNLPWPFIFYGQTYAANSPITVDTNGNIWFSLTTTTPAHTVPLTSTSRGPFIATWNDDLSSSNYGGVFIQHKTDLPFGERIVIRWQTETYLEDGLFVPNSFETILFQDGRIQTDYWSITTALGSDVGSGISMGASGIYLDVTSNYSSIPAMSNMPARSFLYAPISATVNVAFSGTGGGSVTSSPTGIACNNNCSSNYVRGQQVILHPSAASYSVFTGWTTGACSGTADCLLSLIADASTTAAFDRDTIHQVYLTNGNPLYHITIASAYDKAVEGSIIKTWATDYTEVVDLNKYPAISVTLQGGYDQGYSHQTGMTALHGSLKISQGKVIVNGIVIQP